MTRPVEQRLDALDAEAIHTRAALLGVSEKLVHLTHAVGDLSNGQRDLALTSREARMELSGLDARLSRIEREQTQHGDLLRQHGDLLKQILARLTA